MQLVTLSHSPAAGWSRQLPAELDGPQTLVLVFGAPAYAQAPAALQALRAALPQAVQAGCSTAGEIFEAQKDRCRKDRNPAESHADMETREHGRSGGCDKRFHIHAMLF
jgi:hypothetical protein